MDPTAPKVFKTNLATALLMSQNVSGCLSILREIHDDREPGVIKLKEAIERWKHSLGLWKRICFKFYGAVNAPPVTLDFQPGDLDGGLQQNNRSLITKPILP